MAKDPNYGTTFITPEITVGYGNTQTPDSFHDGETPMYKTKVVVDLENPEQAAMLKTFTDFENLRRAEHDMPPLEMTSALKGSKNREGKNQKILNIKSKNPPKVFDTEGQPMGNEVYTGDTVLVAGVPKFNPKSFGGTALLALYLKEVKLVRKAPGYEGVDSGGGSLLGAPLADVKVEGIQLPKVDDGGSSLGAAAPKAEEAPIDLGGIELNV